MDAALSPEPPGVSTFDSNSIVRYVGFWARVLATLVDAALLLILTWPLLFWMYGSADLAPGQWVMGSGHMLVSWVLPSLAVLLLWARLQATPGKMLIGARIVDAQTLLPATGTRYTIRYFAYAVSMLPLMLGCLWVAFDPRKQTWHDKIAGTVVIYKKR